MPNYLFSIKRHSHLAVFIFTAVMLITACAPTAAPTAAQPAPGTPISIPTSRFSDDNALSLMDALSTMDTEVKRLALQQIQTSGDDRFIPVLIELLYAAQVGIVPGMDFSALVGTLESISGQDFHYDWQRWVEWYGGTDIEPPPGFTGWKGRLLAQIDPGFGDFLRDEHPRRIRVEEIQWGGVVVDGIPALDNPPMIPADEAAYLGENEPVFGIAINGEARAYPLRIMDWHEMANDVVGGVPVSLAYCTLCGSGIAYDGRAPDGNTYTFGSSGFLFRSNKLMYDRQTRTLWNQLTGEPVLGELADKDVKLTILPLVLTRWEDWRQQHPGTLVLSLETGYDRPYSPGAAYGDYFSDATMMFPVWQRSDELPPKSRVYAIQLNGLPKAYPLEVLVDEQVVNDTLGEMPLVLVAQRGSVDVQGSNLRVGEVSYNSGGEVRAFERGDHAFLPGEAPDTLLDENGDPWQVTEQALLGPDGQSLPRLPGHLAYWFGWFAFFPNTEIYHPSE